MAVWQSGRGRAADEAPAPRARRCPPHVQGVVCRLRASLAWPLDGFGRRSGVDGLGDCCALPVLFFSEIHALPGLLASASLPFLLHFSLLIYNVSVDWRCTSPFFPVIFNLWETREQVEGHAFVDDVDIWFYLFIGF